MYFCLCVCAPACFVLCSVDQSSDSACGLKLKTLLCTGCGPHGIQRLFQSNTRFSFQFVSSIFSVLILPHLSPFPHLSPVSSVCFRAAPSSDLFPRSTAADTCWGSPQRKKSRSGWASIPSAVAPLRWPTGNELTPSLPNTFHNTQRTRMHLCLAQSELVQLITPRVNTRASRLPTLSKRLPPGPWLVGPQLCFE